MAKRYRSGTIAKTAEGTFEAYALINGERKRKRFKTETLAKNWIDTLEPSLNSKLPPLSSAEILDAAAARAILPPGISLVECARRWLAEEQPAQKIATAEAVEAFLTAKRIAGLRQRTIQDYEYRLSRLIDRKSIADQLLGIDLPQIEGLLKDVEDPTSRDNFRRVWSVFFTWCIRRNWLKKNPCAALEKSHRDEKLPEFMQVSAVQAIFNHASIAIQAELAIAFFAGLRSAEIDRMTWAEVREDYLVVSSAMAKRRKQRFVEISANLRAWLNLLNPGKPQERICKGLKLDRQRDKARALRAAGARWPHNAARHSFATYHLALHQDAARTSLMLGHHSQDMLFRHYRGLTTREEAEKYFAILPEDP
jgi:site-specific recombinase XerC